jgi:hypothetical protein
MAVESLFGSSFAFLEIAADGNCAFKAGFFALAAYSYLPSGVTDVRTWLPELATMRDAYAKAIPRLAVRLQNNDEYPEEHYSTVWKELPAAVNFLANNLYLTSDRELHLRDMAHMFAAAFQCYVPIITITLPDCQSVKGGDNIRLSASVQHVPNSLTDGFNHYSGRAVPMAAPFAFVEYQYVVKEGDSPTTKAHASIAFTAAA